MSLLLESLGWNYPAPSVLEKLKNERMILVFAHTSPLDFMMFMLYRSVCSELRDNLHIVMKPQPFETWGWFLRSMNCIPATRAESNGGGFVERTITNFKHRPVVKIALSPKGKAINSPWRSGYYHLRKGLKANIVAGGLDYERKTLYLGPMHYHTEVKNMTQDELGAMLKEDMSEIVPLYPSRSEVKISRPYNPDNVSLINWGFLVCIIIVIILIIVICILVYTGRLSTRNI
jgi:hypothetical protein